MSSFRFVARPFATEFRRLFTTSPLPSSQLRDQLRWTIDGSAEAFCTSMIIRDSIAESLQMTRTVSLKDWSLDQLMTSDLQDFLAALGEYSKSMAHLSRSQLIDQLRRTLRVSDEVFHSSKANARSFSDSVQVMKSTSPLTGALDRLRPSYPRGIMAALRENSISRMAAIGRSVLTLRNTQYPDWPLWPLRNQSPTPFGDCISSLARRYGCDRRPQGIRPPSVSQEDEFRRYSSAALRETPGLCPVTHDQHPFDRTTVTTPFK